MDITKIGIIGCGVISNTYIKDIKRLYAKQIVVWAVADTDLERAKVHAETYEIPHAYTVEEILQDSEIEIVINLTPPRAHVELNRRILEAGKHVFCEKPFALSVEDAKDVCALAERKGLKIGCAPDTFLGSSLTTCKKLLSDGWIGKPLYVNANMMNSGMEMWHPAPDSFYTTGGGPVFDMGGYYFSALAALFGSIAQVYAVSGKGYEERVIYSGARAGEKIKVDTPTYYAVILTMECGVVVTMNFSFDIWKSSLPLFEVYGTEGTLKVPDPNMYGGVPEVYRRQQKLTECFDGVDTGEGESFRLPELAQNVGIYVRGAGVAELAKAIREGGENRANGVLGTHVVEVMTGIMKSVETGQPYKMKTRYVVEGE